MRFKQERAPRLGARFAFGGSDGELALKVANKSIYVLITIRLRLLVDVALFCLAKGNKLVYSIARFLSFAKYLQHRLRADFGARAYGIMIADRIKQCYAEG